MADDAIVIAGAGLAGAKAAEALRERGLRRPHRPGRRRARGARTSARRSRRTTCAASRRASRRACTRTASTPSTTSSCSPARRSPTRHRRARRDARRPASGSATTGCCSPPARSRGGCRCRAPSSTASTTCARSPTATRSPPRLQPGGRAVVTGGGWIGMEVAASARQKGLDVTIVELEEVPLAARARPRGRADLRAPAPRARRRSSTPASRSRGVEGEGRVERVRARPTAARSTPTCSSSRPRRDPAHRARRGAPGSQVENGILVDASLRDQRPAGVRRRRHRQRRAPVLRPPRCASSTGPTRCNQPEVAARAMLGKPATYDRLPYFFSDQYDVGMEYRGLAIGADELRDPRRRRRRYEFVAFWRREGRVVAA